MQRTETDLAKGRAVNVIEESTKRQEVNQCLGMCYQSDEPLTVLEQRVSDLRETGWDELDIRRFETAVLKLLVCLMTDRIDEPDDTTVD